jgi:anaerobic magnesium-protoporphyrin IX monomethyl ester cyclase
MEDHFASSTYQSEVPPADRHADVAAPGSGVPRRGVGAPRDEVRVYDADVEEQSFQDFLREFKPHLAGITTNTPQVKQSWRTAAAIKEVMDIPVVLGGPHVSVVSEELDFESLRQPPVDLIVRGEGEAPWIEISNTVDDFLRDQPELAAQKLMDPALDLFRETRGVSYKTTDGQLHRNADATPIADLDSLPWPAYHLFKMNKYTNLQPATDAIPASAVSPS